MEAQGLVIRIRAVPFGSNFQALVSGPQTSPLPAKGDTWDRNAVGQAPP